MNPKVEILNHNGVEIAYSDYSGLCGKEFVDTIMSHHRQHRSIIERCHKELRFLTNVADCCHDAEIGMAFKQTVKENSAYIKKSAVIGTVGTQRVLLNAVNAFSGTNSKTFDTMEQALDWLAED